MKWKMTGLFLVPLALMTVAFTFINFAAASYFLAGGEQPEKLGSSPFFSYSEYTRNFQRYIIFADGKPGLSVEGQAQLAQKQAWIQILDENGNEVYELAENTRDFSHEMNRFRTRRVF
ncbi:hypothetical protein [Aneurinibacillus danicus]|uniref:Uncharacterized protein n=1 Tax=Aneurinibacillus danicus TaxID=267746 RepID=A0A511VBK1_9BACL|nr:hypothetical protein [Aneurinibacillus danicus]GEN36297.1 hypothetical protein ADA01nite_37570 [Aneurinibacillus danicus]